MRQLRICVVVVGWLVFSAWPAERTVPSYEEAWQLEQKGEYKQAFLKYLAETGCEHASLRVGRERAAEFLALLEQHAAEVPASRVALAKAGLLLALGRKEEALTSCRDAAARIASKPGDGWDKGLMPADYYPVEPAEEDRFRGVEHLPLAPFSAGPGSHRDNWLIRRFIALDSLDDAAKEFARIWQLHRQRVQPREVPVPVLGAAGVPVPAGGGTPDLKMETRKTAPAGFDALGLQFAIDYAYFLKQQKQEDQALAILLEPLLLLDMDKDPNILRYEGEEEGQRWLGGFFFRGRGHGFSRKEFIRLAYGQFKSAGQEGQLSAALEARIGKGDNRLRRVLARICLQESKPAEALKLELDYITAADFDPLTAAHRRGMVLEDAQRPAEAAAECEKVIALPWQVPRLPDPDEEVVQADQHAQVWQPRPNPKSEEGHAAFLSSVIERLKRLYGALGQGDKVLDLALRQCEAAPSLLDRTETLEDLAARFKAAGQEKRFADWARTLSGKAASLMARANLCWLAKDFDGAAQALAAVPPARMGQWDWDRWRGRFEKEGKDKLRLLLKARAAANPQDARSRLELLDLEENLEGVEAIQTLEGLLAAETPMAFPQGKSPANRTQFKDYYDLAYRLMRLYERTGQEEKLSALGLRVARGDKPFSNKVNPEEHQSRDDNRLPEYANACLALAVQHASDEKSIGALRKALADSPWDAARRQLERRAGGEWKPAELQPFGWANAPADATLLASNGNVISLAHDARYVYAGQPWGVAVYDLKGEPVTRLALGDAAMALATAGQVLWVGAPTGLFCIDTRDWNVAHQRLDGDMSAQDRQLHRDDNSLNNGVCTLALDGELLWLGLRRNVQVLNTRTLELRAFSLDDLRIQHWGGFDRILPAKDYVWADSPELGLRRYDRKTDTWTAVKGEQKRVRLIGDVEGTLFGTVDLPEPLRARPCIIARDTLEITPLLIEGLPRGSETINGPFSYYGKLQGKHVFGAGHPQVTLDTETRKLRPIGGQWDYWSRGEELDSDIPDGLRTGTVWRTGDGTLVSDDSTSHRHKVLGMRFDTGAWSLLTLPGGTRVLAGRRERSPRFQYAEDLHAARETWETWDEEGGLYFVDQQGRPRCVLRAPHSDTLRGDIVFSVAEGPRQGWRSLCTNAGVAVLDVTGRVAGCFSRAEGLCGNRISAGAECGGKLYFACGWNDAGGGLAVFDPATSVFTALFQQDGLDGDKIAGVASRAGKLEITYASEYMRYEHGNLRQCLPGVYDPATGKYASGGKPRIASRDEVRPNRGERPEPLPCLGGFVLQRFENAGKEYLCGTRGLVICGEGARPVLAFKDLGAKVVGAQLQQQMSQAKDFKGRINGPEDLAAALKDDNPYSRTNALLAMPWGWENNEAYVPAVASQANDGNLRLRYIALYRLTQAKNDERAIPALQARLEDPEAYLHTAAAIELARRGHVPDCKHFEQFARAPHRFSSPLSLNSLPGGMVTEPRMYEALAAHATVEVWAFLLQYPPQLGNWDHKTKVYPQLGEALRKQPQCAQMLLQAHDTERFRYYAKRNFAQEIFRRAGKDLLPVLHQALQSRDRVIRSNAARGCGAIGDPSSVQPLLNALDLESGLSRASIVWALGELKAREALPRLISLYAAASTDEQQRARSGVFIAQSQTETQAQYDHIKNVDAVGAEWDELKRAAMPKPAEPSETEDLLSTRGVLEAVRNIGSSAAGEFYRALAADKNTEARGQAAEALAEGAPEEQEKNLAVLKELLGDKEPRVRVPAAVSLHMLGHEPAQKQILEWLQMGRGWELETSVRQLERVKEPAKLAFAQTALESIAKNMALDRALRERAKQLAQRTKDEPQR